MCRLYIHISLETNDSSQSPKKNLGDELKKERKHLQKESRQKCKTKRVSELTSKNSLPRRKQILQISIKTIKKARSKKLVLTFDIKKRFFTSYFIDPAVLSLWLFYSCSLNFNLNPLLSASNKTYWDRRGKRYIFNGTFIAVSNLSRNSTLPRTK